MTQAQPEAQSRPRPGAARARVLAAALDLFVRHGVEGTTLQMIADELGVTKAAVYFQFHAKDDIVRALLEPALVKLDAVCDDALTRRTPAAQADAAVAGIVDIVVDNRRLLALLRGDRGVSAVFGSDERMAAIVERMSVLLLGPEPGDETRVVAAMLGSALMMPGDDPNLDGIDDDTLRAAMLATARRMLRIRPRR